MDIARPVATIDFEASGPGSSGFLAKAGFERRRGLKERRPKRIMLP
ncbi:MAG: hypothetical protein ABSA13_19505 [Beijerinckiaceae bacterium]|jgi:hypothetical protein